MVLGMLKNSQKLLMRVRCIQQFQTSTTDRRLPIHLIKEIFTITVPSLPKIGAGLLQLSEEGGGGNCPYLPPLISATGWGKLSTPEGLILTEKVQAPRNSIVL